jgi:anti-sigma B factor antagonist
MESFELLEVTVQAGPDGATVTLAGELDIFTIPQLKTAIQEALGLGAKRVAVDLAGVSFMDARSLDTLVQVSLDMRRRHQELVIRHPSAAFLRMEELVALDEKVLPLEPCGS